MKVHITTGHLLDRPTKAPGKPFTVLKGSKEEVETLTEVRKLTLQLRKLQPELEKLLSDPAA